jgi:hypothetical protein
MLVPVTDLRPVHRCLSLGGGWPLALIGAFGLVAPTPVGRCHQRMVFAVAPKGHKWAKTP